MGDPCSKETDDKVMDRIEQELSIEQVCDKYNALLANVEVLEGTLRLIIEGVRSRNCEGDYEWQYLLLAINALAATERGECDE